jgi:hypothetical protein
MVDRWTISVPDDVASEVMDQLEWGDNRSEWVVDAIEGKLGRPADDATPSDPVDAVAAAINIGRTDTERDANRELVRVATRWLRDRDGSVRKGQAPLAEWQSVDTHPQAPRSAKTLWNDVIVVAWRRGELVADTDRTFAWVGSDGE